MPTPIYLCFVALREEMGNINARLEDANCPYAYGRFDQKRSQHSYELNRRAKEPLELMFIVLEEMGNISSAAVVAAALTLYRPQAAFILGIAGTLDLEQTKLGDVVVSSSAKFIGPNKVSKIDEARFTFEALAPSPEGEAAAEPEAHDGGAQEAAAETVAGAPEADAAVPEALDPMKRIGPGSWLRFRRHGVELNESKRHIAQFQALQRGGTPVPLRPVDAEAIASEDMASYRNAIPRIRTGAILGSEWVVDSAEFNDFLLAREETDAHDYVTRFGDAFDKAQQLWYNEDIACLDMESYGFFRAIAEHRTTGGASLLHAFSIRGISDPCHNKKGVEKESRLAIRQIAVHNAVETLVDFVFFYAEQNVSRMR